MPGRNIYKVDVAESYYHIYSRGVNKRVIFRESKDYAVFLNLLKRYLGKTQQKDRQGRPYPNFYGDIELLAFCLMPNHVHLLCYQYEAGLMQRLMRGLMTSYSVYFNKTYQRRGPLFESRYKASLISSDGYLQHISRYIHLNPQDWRGYVFSSLPYYLGEKQSSWLNPQRMLDLFDGEPYEEFVSDYESHKKILEELKYELANSPT